MLDLSSCNPHFLSRKLLLIDVSSMGPAGLTVSCPFSCVPACTGTHWLFATVLTRIIRSLSSFMESYYFAVQYYPPGNFIQCYPEHYPPGNYILHEFSAERERVRESEEEKRVREKETEMEKEWERESERGKQGHRESQRFPEAPTKAGSEAWHISCFRRLCAVDTRGSFFAVNVLKMEFVFPGTWPLVWPLRFSQCAQKRPDRGP